MKTLKTQLKAITWLLALTMLFQSCTIYKFTPITLDQAVLNESKVKVRTKTSQKYKFNKIEVTDGNYYGVKKAYIGIIKTPLNENEISSIKEKDKILSIVIPVVISIGVFCGLVAVGAAYGGFGVGYY